MLAIAVVLCVLGTSHQRRKLRRYPELTMTPAGVHTSTVTEYTPQFQLDIGLTDGSGFIDPIDTEISESVSQQQRREGGGEKRKRRYQVVRRQ